MWVCAPRPANNASGLTLHFLDVGQGDGAVIRTPGGRWVVVDAGPRRGSADAGRRVMVPFLTGKGVRELAVVVVSHAHADHIGGIESVLDRFRVGLVLEPDQRSCWGAAPIHPVTGSCRRSMDVVQDDVVALLRKT